MSKFKANFKKINKYKMDKRRCCRGNHVKERKFVQRLIQAQNSIKLLPSTSRGNDLRLNDGVNFSIVDY